MIKVKTIEISFKKKKTIYRKCNGKTIAIVTIIIIQFHSFFRFLLLFPVVLLDTTKEATLEWTRYPYGPQAQTPGVSHIAFYIIKKLVLHEMNTIAICF